MSEQREFFLPSCDGVSRLHGILSQPEEQPRGIVIFSHGIAEYIGRYRDYMRFLSDRGYLCLGCDHLGHGQTAPNEEALGFTREKDGWLTMCDDLEQVRRYACDHYPDLPVVLLGHSMGSFLARTYLIRYPGRVSTCILSGTGQESSALIRGGAMLTAIERKKLGAHGRSQFLENLMFGAYNKPFSSEGSPNAWISRDPASVRAYDEDPQCGFLPTVTLVGDMMWGLQYIWKGENLARMDRDTPILLYSGEKDPVGSFGKGVRKVADRFRKVGMKDVTMVLYPEDRHEVHNEPDRETMLNAVSAWIGEKLFSETVTEG